MAARDPQHAAGQRDLHAVILLVAHVFAPQHAVADRTA